MGTINKLLDDITSGIQVKHEYEPVPLSKEDNTKFKQSLLIITPVDILNRWCINKDKAIYKEILAFYAKNKKTSSAILNALLITTLKIKNGEYQSIRYLSKILQDWKQSKVYTLDDAVARMVRTNPPKHIVNEE